MPRKHYNTIQHHSHKTQQHNGQYYRPPTPHIIYSFDPSSYESYSNISPMISLYGSKQLYQPECQPIDGSTALRSCNIAPIHTQLNAIQFESQDEVYAIHRSTKRQRKQRPYCIIVWKKYIIISNYNILLFRSML
jgi:hypothetical protein